MGFRSADRVKETTTTTGTGTYLLAGAVAGFRTFVAGIGDGNRCIYCVTDGVNWEINEGILTDATPDVLTRAKLIASSTGSAISWGAGTKDIFCVYSASEERARTHKLLADHEILSTTGTEVTGLEFPNLQPGTYIAEYFLLVQSATLTVGIGTGINFTGTATAKILRTEPTSGGTAANGTLDDEANVGGGSLFEARTTSNFSTTAPNMLNTGGVTTINANILIKIEVLLIVTAAGNLELWHSSETATSTTIKAGSSARLTRIDD